MKEETDRQQVERIMKYSPLKFTEEELIEIRVKLLLDALYIPVKGYSRLTKTDPIRLKEWGMDGEPINWGSLRCVEVKKFEDGIFYIEVEEASPGGCPMLCEYIETFMRSWGWECRVKTEW